MKRIVTGVAIAALLGLATPAIAQVQQRAGKAPRVGVLTINPMSPALQDAFRQGLRDHGYTDGQNIIVEWRAADGQADRAKALAEELVALKVDAIVAILTPAVRAAKDATSTIPIIMAPAGAPVATGFVANLARPGGNITGIAGLDAELQGKRIDLLRELIPGLTRVGLLINTYDAFASLFVEETRAAARTTGIQLHIVDVRSPQEVDAAYAAMVKQRVEAVIVQGVLTGPSWKAADLAAQHRLPSLSVTRQFVESGGLLSYAANYADTYRRAASYVDRVLKGAKPGNLPVEQPTTFELAVNAKTARAIGLTIPPSMLLRADQVVE